MIQQQNSRITQALGVKNILSHYCKILIIIRRKYQSRERNELI